MLTTGMSRCSLLHSCEKEWEGSLDACIDIHRDTSCGNNKSILRVLYFFCFHVCNEQASASSVWREVQVVIRVRKTGLPNTYICASSAKGLWVQPSPSVTFVCDIV